MDRRSVQRIQGVARITGALLLLFLLYMLFGHWIGGQEIDTPFRDAADRMAYLLFPWGVTLGLALAFWRPLAGGLFVLFCLSLLFILRPDLMDSILLLFALPALLHILGAIAAKGRIADEQPRMRD